MSSSGEYALVFKDLRDGVLLLLVSYIIVFVVVMLFFIAIFATIFGFATTPFTPPRDLAELLVAFGGGFLALIVGGLIALVVSLIAVYVKLVPGVTRLARLDPEYSTPSTLMKIGYYVGIPLVFLGLVVMVAAIVQAIQRGPPGIGLLLTGLLAGGGIALVGGVLLFIAFIGIIILCFKLADREGLSEYKIAGILFIVALVAAFIPYIGVAGGLLDLVAWILLYIALSRSYRKYLETARTRPALSQQPSPPPPSL